MLFYRDGTKQSTVRIFRDSILYLKALFEYRRWPLKTRIAPEFLVAVSRISPPLEASTPVSFPGVNPKLPDA